ncbi:MAG: hypothetical protein JXQ85_10620 [Cognatishimia sp.]|uniref:hypothetical protein n=1 Tax=Cognatishimia sp. TaxID=2211648 RepID=UPI003B8CC9E0
MLPIMPSPSHQKAKPSEYQKERAHFAALHKAERGGWLKRIRKFLKSHAFVKRR